MKEERRNSVVKFNFIKPKCRYVFLYKNDEICRLYGNKFPIKKSYEIRINK